MSDGSFYAHAIAREIGWRVRSFRRQRGLTQAALAELIARSDQAVRSIERSVSVPSALTLARLVEALDIPASDFFPDLRPAEVQRPREARLRAQGIATILATTRRLSHTDLALVMDIVSAVATSAAVRTLK